MKKVTKKSKHQWVYVGPNEILRAKWGRVSYNPNTGNGHFMAGAITELLNAFGKNVKDGEETALYDGKVWRILTGDFRKEYEKVFPNLKKCITVYKKNKKFRNSYSTD